MNDQPETCLRVAVSVGVKETFFYIVTKDLVPAACVGARVLVPFRNRKLPGYILEKVTGNNKQGLKHLLEVLDPEPLFHGQLVPFFEWMARYYNHPIGRVIQSALPGGLNASFFKTAFLTEKGSGILRSGGGGPEERKTLVWIRDHPHKRLPWPVRNVYGLEKKGWLKVQEHTKKGRTGALMRKFVRPKEGVELEAVIEEHSASLRAKNEVEFLKTVFGSDATPLSRLAEDFANGAYLANKWVNKGVLEGYKGPVYRDPTGDIIFQSPIPDKLNEHQSHVLSHIRKCLDRKTFSSCLLYGVTGSGKTEVYYRAAEHTIGNGRQAILIVPEIALAMYVEGFFRSRLGDRIAIYHSGLSQGERYDQWMRMARGEADLVIGARSALFAPLPRLGLVIVDEEHDSAYKQETNPRYQARDAAVVRAKMENAVVILGSGTPSVQSFHNSITGRYDMLVMPDRVEERDLPDVEIVDMKALADDRPKNEIISPTLRDALGRNLMEGNQTLLFLNRRGFHRLYLCRLCGQSIRCPNCDVALTYHLKEDRLVCHYCGFYSETYIKCPSCGKNGLRAYGFGTEKLEQELRTLFPDAHIARMDTDTTRKKGQISRILRSFGDREIDILVGTQMITKGYDFPNVTMVGVVAADLSLGFPDFRAGERTFQILSQVIGRAGRGDKKGRVVIQAFNPDHYAIRTAMAHDYRLFFEKEIQLRQQLGYPPFSHLVSLRLLGNNKIRTADVARDLTLRIKGILSSWPKRGKEIQVLGPVEATVSRIKGKYRWQILIKSVRVSLLQYFLNEVERLSKQVLRSSGVSLMSDVDPYQMN
ncbi:MAG: primosomal protein N' [Thermodesulfobacteriota bacterium]|nr:primosomal protein N' [Thermodesulfobacteriota bacterium]